jgi:alginate O-acetyltransferase complex protein AlgI
MLFNTLDYVIFLPIVVIIYFLTPHKFRWVLLLAASYLFYMSWNAKYIVLIIISTLIDYVSGLLMEKRKEKKARLPFLILSLCTNLGLLFSLKYFDFASTSINAIFHHAGIAAQIPLMKFLLPVGISFYTFQTLSYSIEVYNGRQKAEKHLGYFALYVSFFPQLVAGPIERFSRLTPQLRAKHTFTYDNLANGLRLILYGLFIKMVIADNLSTVVDQIYAAPQNFGSWDILKGIFLYSFQIYTDFYGYSIIAIGSALIIGINIMDNFKTPYLAKNISEFWQRWHISLSTWFRDYLYYPLGGNRVSTGFWLMNIVVVFVVSGIWHGANWTFVIWGALFGAVYLIEKLINKAFKLEKEYSPYSLGHILLTIKTFVIVSFIWVFFRSQSFDDAIIMFKSLFRNIDIPSAHLHIPTVTLVFLIIFIVSDIALYNTRFDRWLKGMSFIFRWSIYSLLLFAIIVFAGVENYSFIYFQF